MDKTIGNKFLIMSDTNPFNDAIEERRGRNLARYRLVVQKWYNARKCVDDWVGRCIKPHCEKIDNAIRTGQTMYTIRTTLPVERIREMEWQDSYNDIKGLDVVRYELFGRCGRYDYYMVVPQKIAIDMGLTYGGMSCDITVAGNIHRVLGIFATKTVDLSISINLNLYNLVVGAVGVSPPTKSEFSADNM